MGTSTTDGYTRKTVIIVFLWLLAMLVGGILLILFGGIFQGFFGAL